MALVSTILGVQGLPILFCLNQVWFKNLNAQIDGIKIKTSSKKICLYKCTKSNAREYDTNYVN